MYSSTLESGRGWGIMLITHLINHDFALFFLQTFGALDVTTLHCHAPGKWWLAWNCLYQYDFRYCRLDIAYKISKLFQRGPVLIMWVVWLQYWCCVPPAGLAVPLGSLRLRVPLHSGHLCNTQHCVSNDCSDCQRLSITMCNVRPLKQQGRTPLSYIDSLNVLSIWETKWMTYTTKLFWSTSLIGRVSFILRLWCFKGTGV